MQTEFLRRKANQEFCYQVLQRFSEGAPMPNGAWTHVWATPPPRAWLDQQNEES